MKKYFFIFLMLFFNITAASEIKITKGWQLLGTQSDIKDLSFFDKDGIEAIFAYKDGAFAAYPQILSVATLHEIKAGEGYWLQASKDFILTLNTETAFNPGDLYAVNVVKGWRLLGALQNLCVNHIFNNTAIQSVWTYDGSWKNYTPSNIDNLSEIPKGEGYWVSSNQELTLSPYAQITGNIIDGYIKNARLEIASFDSGKSLSIATAQSSLDSSSFIQSDLNGNFSAYINSNSASAYVVRSAGGDDQSSGEKFEGVLKAVVPNLGCTQSEKSTRHVTPVSTVVTKLFSDSSKSTKSLRSVSNLLSDAQKKIATLLGVDQNSLQSDPIALLQSNAAEDKKNASKLIKSAFVLQKSAEVIAKSVTNDINESSVQKSVEIAMDAIAKSLGQTSSDFNTTMLDATTLVNLSSEGFGDLSSQEKLNSIKDVIRGTTSLALKIDEEKLKSGNALNQIELTQKALEAVTYKIEQKLQDVAQAEANYTSGVKAAKDVLKAFAMSGGVEGTRAIVQKEIEKLAVKNEKLDILDFTEKLFDNGAIAKKSEQYNKIFGDDVTTDVIGAVADSFKEVVENQIAGSVVNGTNVAEIIAKNITGLDNQTQQNINSAVVAVQDEVAVDTASLVTTSENYGSQTAVSTVVIETQSWLEELSTLATWQEAKDRCASQSARLPTSAELRGAFYAKTEGFSSVHYYWSATEDSSDASKAIRVFFDTGSSSIGAKESKSFVRCIKL